MVAITKVVSGIALALPAVNAANSDGGSSGNGQFYLGQASAMVVNFFASARADGVPEDRASSEAGHVFTEIWNFPKFQKIASEVIEAVPKGIDKNQIKQFVEEADKAFTEFSNGPSYQPLTSYFKSVTSDFDTNKILSMGKSIIDPYTDKAKPKISSFFADPEGKAIHSTVYNLGKHIASDFGYEQLYQSVPPPNVY